MEEDKILFRCSQLGSIMTEPRSGGGLSKSAKETCLERFIEYRYGRRKDITSKYIAKGLASEESGITLYSRIKKHFYKKNEQRISNASITGIPDLYDGEEIMKAEEVADIKCPWDLFTFYNAKTNPLNKDYYWQLQGYMALTGAKRAILAYCLIDTPEALINDAKRRFMWQACIGDENEITAQVFPEIEKNMIFNDIPMEQRLHTIEIKRNDEDIQKLYNRVIECRYWIKHNLLT